MSAAGRFLFVLAVGCTITFVNTGPPNAGNNRNIPRSQLFQTSYSSEQHGIPQARRDEYVASLEYTGQSINSETDIHNKGSQRTASTNFQLPITGPLSNHGPHGMIDHHIHTSHQTRSSEHLGARSNNHQILTTGASTSRGNTRHSSEPLQMNEPHTVTRGNRRVVTDSALQRTQVNSNLNVDHSQPNHNGFKTNFPEVNTSENNHKSGTTKVPNSGSMVTLQSRNEPIQQPFQSDYSGEKFSVVRSSQNRSNNNENKLLTPSAHGRIVTPTNKNEGHNPNMSTGQKQWETSAPAAILSTAEFGGATLSSKASGGAIVFPDTRFLPEIGNDKAPSCAQGSTYCTDVPDYPVPLISNLKNITNLKNYFGVEPVDQIIKTRFGDDGEEMCQSRSQIIYPKVAQNKDDKWMFIVNLDDKEYVQGIRVELCRNLEAPCTLSQGFPPGYLTTCRQKFVFRVMVAVDDNGEPVSDYFRFPACCACFFRKTPLEHRMSQISPKSEV